MKGGTHSIGEKLLVGDEAEFLDIVAFENEAQDSVVGGKKEMVTYLGPDNLSCRADSGVNDHKMQGMFGEKTVAGLQKVGGLQYILRLNGMTEVDDRNSGGGAEDHSLHDPDVFIGQTEVRRQGYAGDICG